MAPGHQYLPLNSPTTEIRLVGLLPGQRHDELEVYLTQASLASIPND